ncbi:hypothetical protein AWC38_SpisGene21762 [Stylophora pistillata]|uniref:Uncharacterized protein n=1 Tax=Stylophora pistillata TaxID=50429 RepID=A0A2B4RC67_STYPI|nr:hypothetical protein AWC38_SpisGene21762 [Stylophora pistillata]
MAVVFGHVGPFDENTEKFADYAGRYEAFMVANEIAEDRQKLETPWQCRVTVCSVYRCTERIPHIPRQFLKREPRKVLSLVKPSLKSRLESRQAASKRYKDGAHPKLRTFDLHQPVRVKMSEGERRNGYRAQVVAIKGPETYLVRVPGNNRRFVHTNHLIPDDATEQNAKKENIERKIVERNPTPLSQEVSMMSQVETFNQSDQVPNVGTELTEVHTTVVQINSDPDTSKVPVSDTHFVGTPVQVTLSKRVSGPPERLNL